MCHCAKRVYLGRYRLPAGSAAGRAEPFCVGKLSAQLPGAGQRTLAGRVISPLPLAQGCAFAAGEAIPSARGQVCGTRAQQRQFDCSP